MANCGEVLTHRQTAEFLTLSGRTLERMRQTGGGPPFATLGARIVYRRADVEAWLESKLVNSTSASTVRDCQAA